MIVAIDSSVLLAIFNAEPGADAWLNALITARRAGKLVLCEVVYAEVAPAFATRRHLDAALTRLGATCDPIGQEAAWLAGETFRNYRKAGGPRAHLIPDFLIAAHARIQADRLAAVDRGYIRRYFPGLPLLRPGP
ncbi:MAG: type II toxin-antitoxin system VapC family toxin [Candidatus Riflebacteria bacterium]|nr:type II toxin-antitoxin system VapC family toxin [Candidatus Riflebacteria bacterium]